MSIERARASTPSAADSSRNSYILLGDDFRRAVSDPLMFAPYLRRALVDELERAGVSPHEALSMANDLGVWARVEPSRDYEYGFDIKADRRGVLDRYRVPVGSVVQNAMFGLSNEVRRAHEMSTHRALVPCANGDAAFVDHHVRYVSSLSDPKTPADAFAKVVTLKDLPDLRAPEVASSYDLEELLQLRSTDEAEAFRRWVWTVPTLTDEQIEQELAYHVGILGSKLPTLLLGGTGRRLRWMAVQAASLAVGAASSALPDSGAGALTVGATMTAARWGLSYANGFLLDRVLGGCPELCVSGLSPLLPSAYQPWQSPKNCSTSSSNTATTPKNCSLKAAFSTNSPADLSSAPWRAR